MTRVYVAGPMSGLPGFNYQAFNDAAHELRVHGFDVKNPTENGLPSQAPWHMHMRADIAMLVQCDAVLLLPGWEGSRGARLERHIAQRLGFRIYQTIPGLVVGELAAA